MTMDKLKQERDEVYAQYYRLAVEPCVNPSQSKLEELQKAAEHCESIQDEIMKKTANAGG